MSAEKVELLIIDKQFGQSSRACIGKNIANMEISKFVPQILRYWKVEWTHGDDPWETHSMWFYQQKVHFKFTARLLRHQDTQ